MIDPAEIRDDSYYEPSASVVTRLVGDDLVLVDLDAEQFHSLNPVGAIIWSELSDSSSIGSALARVTTEFDVDDATARADLVELVQSLLAMGLLLPVDGAAHPRPRPDAEAG